MLILSLSFLDGILIYLIHNLPIWLFRNSRQFLSLNRLQQSEKFCLLWGGYFLGSHYGYKPSKRPFVACKKPGQWWKDVKQHHHYLLRSHHSNLINLWIVVGKLSKKVILYSIAKSQKNQDFISIKPIHSWA